MIVPVEEIPSDAQLREDRVLAEGEATGHSHRLTGGIVLEKGEERFFRLDEPADLVHQEHEAISLPCGEFRVLRQREYTPQEVRRVQD